MSASVGVLCLIECPERHSCKAGAVLSKLRELRPAPDAYLTLPRIEYCVPGRGFFCQHGSLLPPAVSEQSSLLP